MRTTSKTPGLRIVAGTAYAPAETETGLSDNPLFGRPGQPRNSDDPPLTETAKNGRLRKKRKQIWRMAEAATRYWRVRIDFDHAVSMSACRNERIERAIAEDLAFLAAHPVRQSNRSTKAKTMGARHERAHPATRGGRPFRQCRLPGRGS
jgi:hypothetical protein